MNCPATSWSEVIWRCCLLEAGSWENLEKNEERTDWDVCLLIWCNNFSACSVLPGTGSSWTQIAAFGSVPDDAQDPADFVQAARIQSMSCAYIYIFFFSASGGAVHLCRWKKNKGHGALWGNPWYRREWTLNPVCVLFSNHDIWTIAWKKSRTSRFVTSYVFAFMLMCSFMIRVTLMLK